MRAFVIADASKRKAEPVCALIWEPDYSNDQGRFILQARTSCCEDDLPLSLAICTRSADKRATFKQSEEWVRSRIVPNDRQNLAEVLRANGLDRYDEVSLLAANQGRCSDDDFRVYEVQLTEELEAELKTPDENGEDGIDGVSCADKLIAAVERLRRGREIQYAVVGLQNESAAQHIGSQIREKRLAAGLTQKQLAARAGITQTVLSRTESGSGNPTLALLEELASALDFQLEINLR